MRRIVPNEGVYVLLCGDKRVYVGESNHIDKRLYYHEHGYGSKWTKKYRPLKEAIRIGCNGDDIERRELERAVTLLLMRAYGHQNVAGSYWNSTR